MEPSIGNLVESMIRNSKVGPGFEEKKFLKSFDIKHKPTTMLVWVLMYNMKELPCWCKFLFAFSNVGDFDETNKFKEHLKVLFFQWNKYHQCEFLFVFLNAGGFEEKTTLKNV